MAFTTYPLNNILYQAEDAELFHCTRNSGIYAGTDFGLTITGADNNAVIGEGIAWIKNSRFSGKVAALKEGTTLALSIPPSNMSRYDVIAIRFDKQNNTTSLVVKEGTVATTPTVPTISQTELIYELYLYIIRRDAGDTAITASKVTDVRLNQSYCGLMADSVTSVDTSVISAQVEALITQMEEELESIVQQTGVMLTSTYDTDQDGVVDNSEQLEGHGASYFATAMQASDLNSAVTTIQNAYVAGVKGSSESSYRTGAVNITAANVGAVPTSRTVNGHALSSNVTVTKSDVSLGNVDNVKQMPIAGGTFTGNAVAYSTNRNTASLRNILVQDSSGSSNQSTNYLICKRK